MRKKHKSDWLIVQDVQTSLDKSLLVTYGEMCASYEDCAGCPLQKVPYVCGEYIARYPDDAITRVMEWDMSRKSANTIRNKDIKPNVTCKECCLRGSIFCGMAHETAGNGVVDLTTDDGFCDRGKRVIQ